MYDIAVVGGGLSGLSSAIQLAKAGLNVVLLEKKAYPFHRVCGEYISLETLPFFKTKLDFNPFDHGAVMINQLTISSPKGSTIKLPLDLGGFGISRFHLDFLLKKIAQESGVTIFDKTNVLNIEPKNSHFEIKTNRQGILKSTMAIGAFGKRSNLDRSLKRSSFYQRSPYIGVKHHIRIADFMLENEIALHNFQDGYCGISRVEKGIFCLCYLSHRKNLKQAGNIPTLEKSVLQKNPFLKTIFNEAEFVWEKPLVINEISFEKKTLKENGVWLSGDSAGMITPLCGNGMAMAIHSSYLISNAILDIFQHNKTETIAFQEYEKQWQKHFSTRLKIGRNIQKMFGNPFLTEILVRGLKHLPPVANQLIKLTHGQDFLEKK